MRRHSLGHGFDLAVQYRTGPFKTTHGDNTDFY